MHLIDFLVAVNCLKKKIHFMKTEKKHLLILKLDAPFKLTNTLLY